ncbi:MAG: type I restriction enzyme S subunit [Flavobacteriales bacterium]|jgi:type I restriction enzyme S subunit
MNHKTGMPELRFTGFDSQWESKKVGELCDSIVPGRNKPTNFEGDIPWITTPDIEHNGIINHSKKGLNISREEAKKVGSKIVPINSIIISCVGELGLSAIAGKEIIINQQLHAFIPKERIEYRFLLYQLNLKQKYMDKVATKTAVPYMNKDNCNSIPIDFPTLPEQQKIASFLSSVDEKIQQLSRKKELLEQYKKGVMQQLFSGKLRFKDENGNNYVDWDEKKLGDVINNIGGTALEKHVNSEGKYKFISIGNYSVNGHYIDNKQRISLNEKTKVKLLNKNDLVMVLNDKTTSGDLIGSSILIDVDDTFIYNQRSERLICKQNIFPLFLWFYLNSFTFRKELFAISQGGTQIYVNFPSVKKLQIQIPSIEEQQKIANFLSSIDSKIKSANQQITQTQSFRKGLLQQLFV